MMVIHTPNAVLSEHRRGPATSFDALRSHEKNIDAALKL